MFHTIVSIKNDGHYFCRAGGNRPDGLNEPVTQQQAVGGITSLVDAIEISDSGKISLMLSEGRKLLRTG
ncbi:hypothetical protein D6J33_23300 [Salmonella enterica subsp. enterica serovar Liverpool]|nr:hypothetical protein [Salmonella enterica subsp. enterica serovar Liverpool]